MNQLTQLSLLILLGLSPLMAGHPETDKLIEQAKKESGEIAPKKLKSMLDKEENVIILDVREANQRAEGEIYADEYIAITRGNLEFNVLNKIKNKDAVIVTFCRGGSRGALAAQTLRKLGYKNAVNLKGGLKGWAKEGYPIDSGLGITKLEKE
jgi:rhodanese-related sulfurtransferase